MRVRLILRLSGLVLVACIALVAVTITSLLALEARGTASTQHLDAVVRRVSTLRSLQPDFSAVPPARAIQQWRAAYAELGPMLEAMPVPDERTRNIRTRILHEYSDLDNLFSHLLSAGQDPAGADIRGALGGELSVSTASMISRALSIRDLVDARETRSKAWLTVVVVVSIAALTAIVALLLWVLHKRIVQPIAALEAATAKLTDGFLDEPVHLTGHDEVSALAESFDHMRVTLRNRLDELGVASAQLVDANETLEQRVIERTHRLELALRQIRDLDQAKSRFFANVSHELRTPLALILGPVDELLACGSLAPEVRQNLQVVRRNARTLLAYVNDLLDLVRFDEGRLKLNYQVVDVVSLVGSVTDHFTSAALQKKIKMVVTAPPALAAQIDPDKVHRVIFNLLSNACKFAPVKGGRVDITVGAEEEWAVITVADNGAGIPVGMEELIFERFIQGDHSLSSSGSGLGLAIAREFSLLHGGQISAENKPNAGGCTFLVRLPLRAPIDEPVSSGGPEALIYPQAPFDAEDSDGTSLTEPAEIDVAVTGSLPLVLVVEDNHDLRTFITRALRFVARVALAEDGVDGLAVAKKERPDLILTDIMMPKMTGDQMVAEMRSCPELADTPIMVLSARADEPLRVRLLRWQVQDYLVKPFAADELQARVANLLQVKRVREVLWNELQTREGNLEELAHQVAALNRRLRLAADEMRVARDEAQQASRAKSAFLNMASHELRAPLAQLQLQLELHRRLFHDETDDRKIKVLSGVDTALHRLSRLVNSVLEYSRIESGRLTIHPERFDVAVLVAEACSEVEREAKARGLDIGFETNDIIPPLVSDPAMVSTVVRNLLDNAIKHTQQGKVLVTLSCVGDQIHIEVADTGPGIPTEFQSRMFEPFEHLEDVDRKHVPGVGLGLTLVRDLTERLGGSIQVITALGRGSTFTFELPVTEKDV